MHPVSNPKPDGGPRLPDSFARRNPSASPENDPFASLLDEERVVPRPPAYGAAEPALPAAVSAVEQAISSSSAAFQGTLLQCPFCQSVFRSTVAGQLDLCPVCAAVAKSPGVADAKPADSPGIKGPLPRLSRSGALPAPVTHLSNRRVGRGRLQDGLGRPQRPRARLRLLLLVVVILLVFGLVSVLTGRALGEESTFFSGMTGGGKSGVAAPARSEAANGGTTCASFGGWKLQNEQQK